MAAPIVALDAAVVRRGDHTLLDGVTLGIEPAQRVGVVGRNGAGKSTLLRALLGAEPLDGGRQVLGGGVTVGLLQQADPDRSGTVADLVLHGVERWAADPVAREVMTGLDVERLLDRDLGTLSGGERRRSELAQLLLSDLDLLVLDEPTNHLDILGITWLAAHLTGPTARHRALVAVTHDRWFLDEVATQTWELADGRVHRFEGGYGAYVLARAERAATTATAEHKREQLARKELAWLRRGAPARTSKPRYRVEAAEALIAREPPPRDTMALRRFATARLGRTVLDLEDVTLTVGTHTALEHVTRSLGPGERVGLLGRNGAGKSTLMRLYAGEAEPASGRLVRGVTVALAHLSQHVTELSPTLRLLEAVQEVATVLRVGDRELSAGQLAELFGFGNDRQWTPVGALSGGERRRLQLLRLLVSGPNVLLLDEPTNDLDVDTLVQLEDLLDGWPGTLVVASHDRWFLERTCDVVWAMDGRGGLVDVPGGVSEWVESLSRTAAAGDAVRPPRSAADQRAGQKEMARLERQMQRSARAEAELHEQLAAASTDHERLVELGSELRQLLSDRTSIEEAWLAAAEAAEG